ncbi:hypothetical protein [Variovorax paradoxus]|uniref:hypothetical protein n=1 Tax=Variovorax paradoxus TaxID=34073 RepID=UPI002480F0F1|nr:hypothetical protein [Variovorax paradoxus]WGT63718.1 hypothetical protein QHG62_27440 [Variovorax paradoxus]
MTTRTGLGVAEIGIAPVRNQWQTRMLSGPTYADGMSYSADIYWGAAFLCRLVDAGPTRTVVQAHAALGARAVIWIASYESRPGRVPLPWIASDDEPWYSSSGLELP